MAGGAHDAQGVCIFVAMACSMMVVAHAAIPTVVITAPSHPSPTNASQIDLVVTFSEKVNGFGDGAFIGASDLEFTGGSFVSTSFYTNDATIYYLKVIPSTSQGTLRVVAPAAAGTSESSSEASLRSETFELAYDRVKPTLTLTPSSSAAPSRVSPILFTLVWDEPVTGFDASPGWLSRVAVGGGYVTSSSFNATSSTYSFSVVPLPTPAGAKTGNVSITVAAGVAADAATNVNDHFAYLHAYDYDPPSPAITSTVANPTRTNPIPVVIEWKEAVTPDITLADLEVTGEVTATNFRKVSAGRFELDLVPTGSAVRVQVKVRARVVSDHAGNMNDGTTLLPVWYDTVAPTAASVGVLGGHLPTNQNPITLGFNFSEVVSQFSPGGVTVVSGGGTVTGVAPASGVSDRFLAYLAAPMNASVGTIQIQLAAQAVSDLAGNKNGVGSVISVPYDYSKPTLTMRLAANSTETIAKTPGLPVVVEIESDEDLAEDLAASDVLGQRALLATTDSPLRTVTDKRSYTVGLLPGDPSPGRGQGEAAAVVVVGAVADIAGNRNVRTEFTFRYDFVPPKPTMTMLDGDADRTARTVVPFVLDFGEEVNLPSASSAGQLRVAYFAHNASAAEIAAAAAAAPGTATAWSGVTLAAAVAASSSAAAASSSGIAVARTGPGTFSVNVTVPTATVGKLTLMALHIQPGAVADLAGHPSEEARFQPVTHDSKAPVITFLTEDDWRVTNANPVPFTFEIDEPVLGLSSADVEVYGGSLVPGSFKTVEASPTPALMASAGGAGQSTEAAAAAGMVAGTGAWGRKFTFTAVPSSRQGTLTVEIRRLAARDQTGVDVLAAVRQDLSYDYVRPKVTLLEVAGTAAIVEYLGGYKNPADVRKTLIVVEAIFDEPVEKVNSSAAAVVGGGGTVYSPAKVVQGTEVANFTAGVASERWRFLVLLDDAEAPKAVEMGEGAGMDVAGNPSLAATQAMSVPSAVTLLTNSGAGRVGGLWVGWGGSGGGLAFRAMTLATACALALSRQ